MTAHLFSSLDVVTKVLSFLDVSSIGRVARTSKLACECVNDEMVWHRFLPRISGVNGTFGGLPRSTKECAMTWITANACKRGAGDSPAAIDLVQPVRQVQEDQWMEPVGVHDAGVTDLLMPFAIVALNKPASLHAPGVHLRFAVDQRSGRVGQFGEDIARVADNSASFSGFATPNAFTDVIDRQTSFAVLSEVDAAVRDRLRRLVCGRSLHGQVLETVLRDLLFLARPADTRRATVITDPATVETAAFVSGNPALGPWLADHPTLREHEGRWRARPISFRDESFVAPAAAIEEREGCYKAHAIVYENWKVAMGAGFSHSVFLACLEVTPAGFTLSLRMLCEQGDHGAALPMTVT